MIFKKEQDMKDVKLVLGGGKLVFLASGEGEGDNAVVDAIKHALDSPFIDNMEISKGYGVLMQLYSKRKINLYPCKDKKQNKALRDALDLVWDKINENADVVIQSSSCYTLPGDQIKILIVATGK